ncbi:MAG: hypothetical protein KVP17_004220 [Porospora cf. gigantea B]|uniref:uncharacterized protein n=2 Tax=Porospora cf. gigantea B TaxID=2853592 RepID=UPI003571D29A|nr:MAG: hypothetical protein KVP17_004220 [Porospora cf. gigantea B]
MLSALSNSEKQEIVFSLSALILSAEGKEVSAANLTSLVKASGVEAESYMPALFARACQGVDIKTIVDSFSVLSAGPATGAPAATAAAEPEPEPESEEESDDDLGFSLFD